MSARFAVLRGPPLFSSPIVQPVAYSLTFLSTRGSNEAREYRAKCELAPSFLFFTLDGSLFFFIAVVIILIVFIAILSKH